MRKELCLGGFFQKKRMEQVEKQATIKKPKLVEKMIEPEVVECEIHPANIVCPDCGGITLQGLDYCDKWG